MRKFPFPRIHGPDHDLCIRSISFWKVLLEQQLREVDILQCLPMSNVKKSNIQLLQNTKHDQKSSLLESPDQFCRSVNLNVSKRCFDVTLDSLFKQSGLLGKLF